MLMGRYYLPLWVPLVVLYLVGVAGFWCPNYVPACAEAVRKSGGEQWLGFAGSVISAAVAAVAVFFAWRGIVLQMQIALVSREEERMERALPGLIMASNFMGRVIAAIESVPD